MNDGSALFQSEKCKLTCLCRRWRLPSSPAIWTHRLTTTPAAPCAAYPSPCPYPSRPWPSRAPQSCPRPCSSALRQPSPDIGTVGPAAPSSSPTGRRGWRRRGQSGWRWWCRPGRRAPARWPRAGGRGLAPPSSRERLSSTRSSTARDCGKRGRHCWTRPGL